MSARPEAVEAAMAAILQHFEHFGEPSPRIGSPVAAAALKTVVEAILEAPTRQPYRRGYTFLELPFQPRVHRDGRLYRVRYGEEVRGGLSYDDAIRVLGKCLMHSLTCDGRLD